MERMLYRVAWFPAGVGATEQSLSLKIGPEEAKELHRQK